jgi:hypothetical protein
MPILTKVRYHIIPVRIASIKKIENASKVVDEMNILKFLVAM